MNHDRQYRGRRKEHNKVQWIITLCVFLVVAVVGGCLAVRYRMNKEDNVGSGDDEDQNFDGEMIQSDEVSSDDDDGTENAEDTEYSLNTVTASPEELFTQYISELNDKDYKSIYEGISKPAQAVISLEDFLSRYENIYDGIEAENIQAEILSQTSTQTGDTEITYEMSMDTVAGELKFENTAVYQEQAEGGYVLLWDHDLILPNLGSNDKVKVIQSEPDRGSIYDRNGVLLAGKGTASSVGIVPGKLGDERESNLKKIAKLLDTDVETLEKKLSASWVTDDSFVPIKTLTKVEEEDVVTSNNDPDVLANYELQQSLLEVPGVKIQDTEVRIYPLGECTSALTGYIRGITAEEMEAHNGEGYTSTSSIGKSGLELTFESELRGKVGYKIEIVNSYGKEKEVVLNKPKENGKDITLTIDALLQKSLYQQFEEDDSCSVAMNPYTGEILALVSTPSFDSNDFVNGLSTEKWNELSEDERKPMWNRYKVTWCPGSSFKPVVAAIGITTGLIDPQEDFGTSGKSWQKDASWGKYYVTTLHTYQNAVMKNALIYSDNIYFAKAALKIGADNLVEQLKNLGLGETMPFDIDLSMSQYSNTDTIDDEIQLADSGYGQGEILMNPVHLTSIYSAFLNEGDMVTPYLVYDEERTAEFWKEDVFSSDAVDQVKDALIQVIEDPNGTGHACQLDGVTLAGKTGTAEIKASKTDTSGTELGWFVAFPTETKKKDTVLLLTMVENVKEIGGSTYVVKKEKNIIDQLYGDSD